MSFFIGSLVVLLSMLFVVDAVGKFFSEFVRMFRK